MRSAVLVDAGEKVGFELVGRGQVGVEVGRKAGRAALDVHDAAQQRHTIVGELMQVQAAPAIFAGDVWVARKPGARRRQLVHGTRKEAKLRQPLHDILAPIAARHAAGAAAHAQVDLAPAQVQLLGDLAAGLRRPHDQYGARGSRAGLRYASDGSWRMAAGKLALKCGILGCWNSPVATTTLAAT